MPGPTLPVADTDTREKDKLLPRWLVIGLDDDVTGMDYVIYLLEKIFNKDPDEAYKLMMEVHEQGFSIFYIGSYEACELKVDQVKAENSSFDQVFRVKMEPDE